MRKLVNASAMSFQGSLPDRRYYDVIVAKRSYQLTAGGRLEASREQELLSVADTYRGDPANTSMVAASDIVPFKPVSDIILAATACTPFGQPAREWICGIEILGERPLSCFLRVTGPRQWNPVWRGPKPKDFSGRSIGFSRWELSEPSPASRVELIWENAWGGQHPARIEGQQILIEERNPVGIGWIHPDRSDHRLPVPAPRIEWPDQPISDPCQIGIPAAVGPVSPAWMPRRPLGGLYDEAWMNDQRPFWPMDYSAAYHNAAPAAMQMPGYLRGDEVIRLHALHAEFPLLEFRLPATALVATIGGNDYRLAPDTLHLDLRMTNPEDWVIATTWRLALPPGMAVNVTLDEIAILHERYNSAHRPFLPTEVAALPEVQND